MVIINQMEFNDWLNAQFMKWQGDHRRTITEFAAYLGVKQPALTMWLKDKNPSRPDYKNAIKLAAKLGPEVYEVLGMIRPEDDDHWSPESLRLLRKAGREIEATLRERNLTGEMPEAEVVAIKIMARYGLKLIKRETTEEEPK